MRILHRNITDLSSALTIICSLIVPFSYSGAPHVRSTYGWTIHARTGGAHSRPDYLGRWSAPCLDCGNRANVASRSKCDGRRLFRSNGPARTGAAGPPVLDEAVHEVAASLLHGVVPCSAAARSSRLQQTAQGEGFRSGAAHPPNLRGRGLLLRQSPLPFMGEKRARSAMGGKRARSA